MATKSTILKVPTQILNKGFTLIELIVSLVIFTIVGGLAMNALVESSKSFSDDKRNIDSSQNLSAVLEMIGNDIKQAGEQINEGKFPVITIEPNPAGMMSGSSRITIRRALTTPLALCQSILSTASTLPNTLLVTDSVGTTESLCQPGTTLSTTTLPTTPITRPTALREARNYRCKLDLPNEDYTVANTDFCNSSSLEHVRAAMSDGSGNIRTFDYKDDNVVTANTQFNIKIDTSGVSSLSTSAPQNVDYAIGKAIYLIEERTYTLDTNGDLKLQIDGGSVKTLISGIKKFNIFARVYKDKVTKTSDPIDGTGLSVTRAATAACPSPFPLPSAAYICQFNSPILPSTTPVFDDWKTLQGIKVELQAKYDPTGRSTYTDAQLTDPNTTVPDILKLRATAEFFPRNVLSK